MPRTVYETSKRDLIFVPVINFLCRILLTRSYNEWANYFIKKAMINEYFGD